MMKTFFQVPVNKDLLIAWALKYMSQPAGKTVGAKILALKKEEVYCGREVDNYTKLNYERKHMEMTL